MKFAKVMKGALSSAAIAAMLLLPVTAVSAATQVSARKVEQVQARKKSAAQAAPATDRFKPGALGSFTPAVIDPARSPARMGAQVQERSFQFTPSGKVGDRKALAVGVTTRVVRPATEVAQRGTDALLPTGYNFDLAVGYKGFSVSGGYSRLENGFLPGREGIDLGLSYHGNRWQTTLQLGATHDADGRRDALGLGKHYSVELGGAYALTPRLSLSGGVRYQLMRDDMMPRGQGGRQGEDGAVFVGTAFSF